MTEMTFDQYEALAHLVKYGNLYHLSTIEHPNGVDRVDTWWRSQDPEDPGDHLKLIHNETVKWLQDNYLSRPADFDPLLVRAKVVPTDKGRERLENHGLAEESEGIGVHLGHCCLRSHGCKYGDEFCPVVTGMFPPESDKCGACYEDEAMDRDSLKGHSDDALINALEDRGYTVTRPA